VTTFRVCELMHACLTDDCTVLIITWHTEKAHLLARKLRVKGEVQRALDVL
jgi:hypothetical protein